MPPVMVKEQAPAITPPSSPKPQPVRIESKKNTVLQSHGRRPWYGENGVPFSDAFVIGIAGGSASGKTHVAQQIVRSLGSIPTVVILSQDSFYKPHSPEDLELAFANQYDFDHPDAIDMVSFASCLNDLKACKQTNIPVYSFSDHQRLPETKYLYGAAIIIAEGILALHDPAMRALYDLKASLLSTCWSWRCDIFVQCDSDFMLARRIHRDVQERGRNVEGVLKQYLRFVKPAFDNFVAPSSKFADIIVPGSDNTVAIELISTHIQRKLKDRYVHIRPKIARGLSGQSQILVNDVESLNITLLEETSQLKAIYTILRDKTTRRNDFIFYTDRLATFLAEKAMELLPFQSRTVRTPTDATTQGKELNTPALCGVSIIRSGGPLECGLRRVIRDVALGSLLIQTDPESGEPMLLHLMLPSCIKLRHLAQSSWVLLLDAQAAAAMMAIRILLDHGVCEKRIVFITFIVARNGGVSVLRQAFPGVRIVTGAVDNALRVGWLDGAGSKGKGRDVWVIGDHSYSRPVHSQYRHSFIRAWHGSNWFVPSRFHF
ncbi:armadillo/beta-catenin/plakoglobin [Ramaria rubella]|nr:armadillo/beta-catenin/plakoglobin [Ramaria rubella]